MKARLALALMIMVALWVIPGIATAEQDPFDSWVDEDTCTVSRSGAVLEVYIAGELIVTLDMPGDVYTNNGPVEVLVIGYLQRDTPQSRTFLFDCNPETTTTTEVPPSTTQPPPTSTAPPPPTTSLPPSSTSRPPTTTEPPTTTKPPPTTSVPPPTTSSSVPPTPPELHNRTYCDYDTGEEVLEIEQVVDGVRVWVEVDRIAAKQCTEATTTTAPPVTTTEAPTTTAAPTVTTAPPADELPRTGPHDHLIVAGFFGVALLALGALGVWLSKPEGE